MLPWAMGEGDAIAGKELWENPFSGYTGKQKEFEAWFAGWCYGKLIADEQMKSLEVNAGGPK